MSPHDSMARATSGWSGCSLRNLSRWVWALASRCSASAALKASPTAIAITARQFEVERLGQFLGQLAAAAQLFQIVDRHFAVAVVLGRVQKLEHRLFGADRRRAADENDRKHRPANERARHQRHESHQVRRVQGRGPLAQRGA